MHKFSNDDEGYLGWLAANPDGFVVNVRQVAGPNYAVLHRATCRTIGDGTKRRCLY